MTKYIYTLQSDPPRTTWPAYFFSKSKAMKLIRSIEKNGKYKKMTLKRGEPSCTAWQMQTVYEVVNDQ